MRAGRAWEAQLELWHRAYRRDRLAWVAKTDPPVKMLSRKDARGRFTACYERDGAPDYVGVLAGGRGVVFDAKDCDRARWPLDDLQLHQARDLEAAHDRGGLAFVALRLQGACWVLSWEALGPVFWRAHEGRAGRGEHSLSPADVAVLGRPMGPDGWLESAQ